MVKGIEIYADGASIKQMHDFVKDPRITGFTCNPTLMKQQGIMHYRSYAAWVVDVIGKKPVSFEVLADDLETMEAQAREIDKWGPNIYVKVPVCTSSGEGTGPVIRRLTSDGIRVNVTAVMTVLQLALVLPNLIEPDCIVSIFAGRIADTRVDPEPIVTACASLAHGKARVLWASAREVFNIVQAERAGADIITLSPELIAKLDLRGKDLHAYSVETSKQFHADGLGIAF